MFCGLMIFVAILMPAIGQDVDECALGTHNCHVEANCINTDGGYTCQCKDWFAGDGYYCRGFCNESCSSTNGICREGVNGYTCFCQRSSCPSDDVPVIHNINLLWRTHNSLFFAWTSSNAYSVSATIPGVIYNIYGKTQGGYIYLEPDTEYVWTLTVRNSHSRAEKNATVKTLPAPTYPTIPPVNTSSCDNCGNNSHCNITEGGFTCTCDECYVGDGFSCTQHCGGLGCFDFGDCYGDHRYRELNFTAPPVITNLRSTWIGSTGLSFAWDSENVVFANNFLSGDDISYEQHIAGMAGFSFLKPSTTYNLTVTVYNTIGNTSYASISVQTKPFVDEPTNSPATTSDVCGSGFQLVGSECVDVDECSEGTHNCHEEAVCTNTPGRFKCACNLGYFGNGTICVGICESSSYSICGFKGYCGQNEYGTSCFCYGGCTGDPAVMITTKRRGPDYVSISWQQIIPSLVEYIYDVNLYESGALVASYGFVANKKATFGSLKPETTYTVVLKPSYDSSNYSANFTFFTGTSTTAATDMTKTSPFTTSTTNRPFTTDKPTTTSGPGGCDNNSMAKKYREAAREWQDEFQKWKDCHSSCEP